MQPYSKTFYEGQREGSRLSAREVVPLVLELMHPKRVVDVGCGVGTWLVVFNENGVEETLGVDGDHVDKTMLQIPQRLFHTHDLKQPLFLDNQFDLALSLEVAEHLPAECAETFVESLTRLAPLVLFSAAAPYQGGTHHVNEQWPDYWHKLFYKRDYEAVDCIRRKIWRNDNVEWWYAQNIILFARKDCLESNHALGKEFARTDPAQLSIIHPKAYLERSLLAKDLDPKNRSLKQTLSSLPTLTKSALEKRVKKLFGESL